MDPKHVPSIGYHPRSILLATNLKDLHLLLPVAREQARATGAMLSLVHVVPPEVYPPAQTGTNSQFHNKGLHEAGAVLARASFEMSTENVNCTYDVRCGSPVDRIIELIREREISCLILGTSSRGKASKLLTRSVAEALIHNLDIPVCTVGPHCGPVPKMNPRRVLFATSLQHEFAKGFQFASDLASVLPAELTILHVTAQDLPDEGTDLRFMSKIDRLLKNAPRKDLVLHIRLRSGDPAEEIVRECLALRPAFLVLGAGPASPMSANFRSGVASKVIAQVPCPTFTIRNPKAIGGRAEISETHRVS
jgi:nucleotide-binding universal stress UspA family protein